TTTTSTTTTTRVRHSTTTTTIPPGKTLFLYVANSVLDNRTDPRVEQTLMRYDGLTGAPRGSTADTDSAIFVPFDRPGSRAGFIGGVAADGNDSVCGALGDALYRWDASTGANKGVNGNPLNARIPLEPPASFPYRVQLGPDGLLWVMSLNDQGIFRVHPETGE